MRVLVLGAGIGGLSTALSLHAVGITDVVCLEAAEQIQPLGVGINLLPHAVRELVELGLAPDLDKVAVRTADLTYVNEFGSTIWSEPRGVEAGYDWPQYSIHRGEFQLILARRVRELLGEQAIQTARRITSVEAWGETARVRWEGGDSSADVVIACDGIHSTVRAQWHPDEGPPLWNGAVLWRGVSRAVPFLTGRSMIMAGHRERKFVAYPIGPVEQDGRQRVNWIAEQFDPARDDLQNNWNREVDISRFAGLFGTWDFGWLDVPALIASAEKVLEYPMVDRDPLGGWVRGRVVLLGDAAHPTYPIGSNGSSQAVLDARVLAFALATMPIDEALAFYEAERLPRTRALQEANRQMGPEIVLQTVHERAPHGFQSIDDVIPADELATIAGQYKRVAGFDPAGLNARPSWDPARR